MRKLSEIMELMIPLYNPWIVDYKHPAQFYFCDCVNELYNKSYTIFISEMDVVHRYIHNRIEHNHSLTKFLFGIEEREELTEDQKIQMVMFWINLIEELKEQGK